MEYLMKKRAGYAFHHAYFLEKKVITKKIKIGMISKLKKNRKFNLQIPFFKKILWRHS